MCCFVCVFLARVMKDEAVCVRACACARASLVNRVSLGTVCCESYGAWHRGVVTQYTLK